MCVHVCVGGGREVYVESINVNPHKVVFTLISSEESGSDIHLAKLMWAYVGHLLTPGHVCASGNNTAHPKASAVCVCVCVFVCMRVWYICV